MSCIKVTNITVKKYRIVCLVQIHGEMYSNSNIKKHLLKQFSSLAYHKCKNANGENFISIMDKTSLAHIFEHLVIDLQIKYSNKLDTEPTQAIFGTTEWLNKNFGKAKVELSYFDDIEALRAIKNAQEILNEILENS